MGGAQHVEGAIDIAVVRSNGLFDGPRYRGNCGFMEDYRRPPHERRNLLIVANIDALEIHGLAHFLEISLMTCQKIVDHHNLSRAFLQKTPHNGGADEARAPCYYVVAHDC